MPIKIPNTYNAQTPMGQAVSNAMTAYFSSIPTGEEVSKAEYMRQQGDLMAAQAEQARRKGASSEQIGGLVREYMQKQRPQPKEQEQPRPSQEFAGPMPPETVMVPGMSREDANAAYVPDILAATYAAGHGMKLPDLMLALAPLQGNASAEDYTGLSMGTGKPYSSTVGGFREKQAADIEGQRTKAAAVVERKAAADNRKTGADKRADDKKVEAADKQVNGRRSVESALQSIDKIFDDLQASGGAISTENSMLDNLSNAAAARGGVLTAGTKNQALRNELKSKLPLVSAAVKNATGKSAQELNSNVELQMFMKALTDPDVMEYETAKKVLSSLSSEFGLGGLSGGKTVNPITAPSGQGGDESAEFTRDQLLAERERRQRMRGGR
jgi:hypothetical protein